MTSDQVSLGSNPKKVDENSKKNEKTVKKDKERSNVGSNTVVDNLISSFEKPDEEWKEVEDEQEKDYSGLRIQSLSLADGQKDDEYSRDQLNQEGNGDDLRNNEGPQGPWKLSGGISEKEEEVEEPEDVEQEKAPSEITPRSYVPPQMRNQQNNQSSYPQRNKYGKVVVPEMDSEIHFPSLASVSESDKKGIKNDDRSFQSVTRGSKNRDDINHGAVKVETGNKYSALRQRDYSH